MKKGILIQDYLVDILDAMEKAEKFGVKERCTVIKSIIMPLCTTWCIN